MGFGYRDGDWVEPPEEPPYSGRCGQCGEWTPCPAECGWGTCNANGHEFFAADEKGCEDGFYADGCFPDCDDDGDAAYDRWKDGQLEDMPGFAGTAAALGALGAGIVKGGTCGGDAA